MTNKTGCACEACAALEAECGEHFPHYAKKLLIKGWAGVYSSAEKAYCRAHRKPRSEAQQAALRKASESSPLTLFPRNRGAEAAVVADGADLPESQGGEQ